MWSDVLARAEQLHALRLSFWGGTSAVIGTALLVLTIGRNRGSPLVRRFALTCAALGALELVVAGVVYRGIAPRDVSGAARLERVAWLQLGLFIGLAGAGAAIAIATYWVRDANVDPTERSLSATGVGLALAVHGIALAVLELLLLADISR